jgi:hypothetical protein
VATVIDDRLLLDVIAGTVDPATAAVVGEDVLTTGSWYYRLGRALSAGSGTGTLSGRLQSLDPSHRDRATAALRDLPAEIGLLHPRVVVPVMFSLRVRRPLNVLNADALATALLADATIAVSTDAPLLREAAADLGIGYSLLT